MSIRITVSEHLQFPVRGTFTDEAGAAVAFDFRLTARRLPQTSLEVVLADKDRKARDFLGEVVTAWSGVLDDDGKPVPYSPEGLGSLLASHAGLAGLAFAAYLEHVGARAKN